MKHAKRIFVVLLLCVAGLAAILLALHSTSSKTSSSSGSSLQTTSLYNHKDSDLVRMTVKNTVDTYTIVPDREATAEAASEAAASAKAASSSASAGSRSTSSAAAAKTVFKVQELSGVAANADAISTAAQDGYNLSALKNIGAAETLSDYGLQNPEATVTSTFTDGTKIVLQIGKPTPLDSSARYIKLAGNSSIYTATIADALLKGKDAYVSTQVLTISGTSSNSSSAAEVFRKINIQNQTGTADLTCSGTNWFVNGRPADNDAINTLTSSISSVSGSSVEAMNPTAAQLKQFGLASPSAKLTYTATTGTGTLLVGSQKIVSTSSESDNQDSSDSSEDEESNRSETEYSVMLQGGRAIYLVSSSNLPWLTQKAFDFQRKELLVNTQTDIANVLLQGDGLNCNMAVTRTKNENSSTEDVPSYNYATALNGKKITKEDTFSQFFTQATNLKILENSSVKPSGTPEVTLTLTGFDAKVHHVYQFYKSSDRRCLATADGVTCGLINRSDLQALLTAAKAVK